MSNEETSEQTKAAVEVEAVKAAGKKSGTTAIVVSILVVAVALIVAALVVRPSSENAEAKLVQGDKYQAVFLTNGQVYFGKLSTIKTDYVTLTDIYYLQVQQAVQPTGTDKPATDTSNSQTQLVKLGDELHGPEDAMQINRDQVQFWENLKSDGKVAQAIAENKKK